MLVVAAMTGFPPFAPSGAGRWYISGPGHRRVRHHLTRAPARLADPTPRPGQRHWSAPPLSRILGPLRLFTHLPPTPCTELPHPSRPVSASLDPNITTEEVGPITAAASRALPSHGHLSPTV
ncbi:hypothetical protein GCM10009603_45370 [Nocardiopsis exhalans]